LPVKTRGVNTHHDRERIRNRTVKEIALDRTIQEASEGARGRSAVRQKNCQMWESSGGAEQTQTEKMGAGGWDSLTGQSSHTTLSIGLTCESSDSSLL
jgi:hypothetical protein